MNKLCNFHGQIGHDLREQNISRRLLVNSAYNSTKRISFQGPKIWKIIPDISQNSFKKEIKTGNPMTALAGYVKHIYKMLGFPRIFFLDITL